MFVLCCAGGHRCLAAWREASKTHVPLDQEGSSWSEEEEDHDPTDRGGGLAARDCWDDDDQLDEQVMVELEPVGRSTAVQLKRFDQQR